MANPQFVYHMHKLSKTYPGGKQVLKDINLSFYPGAKIGVVGLNGAGKATTTLGSRAATIPSRAATASTRSISAA